MAKRRETEADILLWDQLKELRNTTCFMPLREHQFFDKRRWRFDFVLTSFLPRSKRLAIEIEGGAFTQGRHTRGVGFIKDMEKYNHAALLGWRVLRFVPSQVLDGTAIAFIKRVLEEGQ